MDQNHSQSQRINGRSVFSLCRQVLDMYPFKNAELDERRKKMSETYNEGTKLDYESEITHCAYIRSDVTVHACAIADFIKTYPQLYALFQAQELTIASVGCGPGSDMIGVLLFASQYLSNSNFPIPILRFALYDSVPTWQKAINRFESVIRRPPTFLQRYLQAQEILPTCFEKTFYEWNVTTNPRLNFIDYPSFRAADLFIFSMIFSDICKQSTSQEIENVKMNIQCLCERAKIGSLFLFIDVYTKKIKGFPLESFLRGTAFNSLNCILEFCHNGSYGLPVSEHIRELGPYFSKNSYIALGANLSVLLFRKIAP